MKTIILCLISGVMITVALALGVWELLGIVI